MKLLLTICSLLATIVTSVSATALTYKLAGSERACFFAHAPTAGAKIAFYFAVWIKIKRARKTTLIIF